MNHQCVATAVGSTRRKPGRGRHRNCDPAEIRERASAHRALDQLTDDDEWHHHPDHQQRGDQRAWRSSECWARAERIIGHSPKDTSQQQSPTQGGGDLYKSEVGPSHPRASSREAQRSRAGTRGTTLRRRPQAFRASRPVEELFQTDRPARGSQYRPALPCSLRRGGGHHGRGMAEPHTEGGLGIGLRRWSDQVRVAEVRPMPSPRTVQNDHLTPDGPGW